MNIQNKSRYHEVHARSLRDPEGFWAEAAREIDWIEPAKKIFDPAMGAYGRWFAGAVVNTCYNALDRHVANGRADQVALIHDSPLTNSISKFTYAEMLKEVQTLAAVMADFGVAKGDRVILYMPLVPEAVFAMLACARIGAVHSVVFGGFAAKELATRIEDAKPKLIFSASCGIEPGRIVQYKPLLDEAIRLSSVKPRDCVILQRPQQACELTAGRDHDWATLRGAALAAGKAAPCTPVLATDPLYILYTSGTTGIPKGVVRDNGGHLVALKWSMFNLYGVKPGEVWWCGSDIGWVVGHSYIVYGPLIHGATSIMYEGKPIGTPDAGAFWRVISEHKAVALFTAPTAFRAIRKEDPGRRVHPQIRSVEIPYAVPGRRARRSADGGVGGSAVEGACDRSLVADRNRLVHRRQSGGLGHASSQARLADGADAGLSGRCGRRGIQAGARGHHGLDRDQAADAAGLPADIVGAGCALQGSLPHGVSRLLQDLGRRLQG